MLIVIFVIETAITVVLTAANVHSVLTNRSHIASTSVHRAFEEIPQKANAEVLIPSKKLM